ncbi:SpoIIIAH-like family protein [Niallia sp. 03133]|uniref:SpoIIIAH-like family protein n=1 Tax=Niallia sp. 03133 TaxID=3458060 RepID=UPI0040440D64
MLLKKQTVWLLTMLSLVVVLSVYYITSPEQKNEFAAVDNKQKKEAENTAENAKETKTANKENANTEVKEDGSTVSTIESDEEFEQMRLDLQDQRSMDEEKLTEVMGSADSSAEEKSEAQDEIEKLRKLADQEKVLETMIKAENYDDVLVRTIDGIVNVTVKADKLSPEAANDIIQLVRKNLEEPGAYVAVKFDPNK